MKKKSIVMIIVIVFLAIIIAVSCILGIKHLKIDKDELITNENNTSQSDNTTNISVDKNDWRLILVNYANRLPNDYSVDTVNLSNGIEADERCYSDLQKMLNDCKKAGLSPIVCSGYRSQEKQEMLYENSVQKYRKSGLSDEAAKIEAAKLVAPPGTSEHQTGLAFDIVDMEYQLLDLQQEKTPVQKWLLENSWKYGFILRYPPQKSDITKIDYEPWHYRYVGKENAKIIHSKNLCLEEYLQFY